MKDELLVFFERSFDVLDIQWNTTFWSTSGLLFDIIMRKLLVFYKNRSLEKGDMSVSSFDFSALNERNKKTFGTFTEEVRFLVFLDLRTSDPLRQKTFWPSLRRASILL